MTLWQRWKKVSINNKLTIYMTAILAVATTLYTLMYFSQVKFTEENARQTSEQTNRLIAASEKQAAGIREALEETKRANRDAADRAERALSATEKQANASLTQANTSQIAARAAEQSARISEQTLRAQIAIQEIRAVNFEADQPIRFIITWKNDGNSPATITGTVAKVGIVTEVPSETICQGAPNAAMRPITVNPHNTRPQTISVRAGRFTAEQFQSVKDGKSYFLICGQVIYETVGKREAFPLCGYSSKDLSFFLDCGTGID
jgi:hypothetical protein